ncbi:MAG: hypothetical protein EZS28_024368 [Streblomastix strix]|uniref:Uncharacterized protein n=1 Tax=Streblomastix strix TaxID=222440 RepID=A0A5J4VC09_9EUKA|nr:MAG: hypothetical protein EZS28_024368 [Streblomastix strix]
MRSRKPFLRGKRISLISNCRWLCRQRRSVDPQLMLEYSDSRFFHLNITANVFSVIELLSILQSECTIVSLNDLQIRIPWQGPSFGDIKTHLLSFESLYRMD